MKRTTLTFLVSLLGCLWAVGSWAADAPASRLDQILAKKRLTICTTGDYKPYTFLDKGTGKFEGIDIELVQLLGQSLGKDVEVVFVQTSWPNLMKDFLDNKCDISAGGVTITLDRLRQVYFSQPIANTGKTPITRCENVSKFQTLEQIDQASTRAIVNPGGTNEKFAKANLKKASLEIYPDNVTVFEQILKGKADLMITDAEETLLQQKLLPGLCAVHPEKPFTFGEKAYMLPRGDEVFKHYIDQWIHLIAGDGTLDRVKNKWLK